MLKQLADKVLQRNDATNATTYATHNATVQLFGGGNATDYATCMQPTPLKALSKAILNATDHATSMQLDTKSNATFYATFRATDHATLGKTQLRAASKGLPVDLDELLSFFADDLQDIATGVINPDGLQQAVEWFTYSHLKRTHKPVEPSPQDMGMVRCTECQQSNCRHIGRQSSPAYRWCSDYNKAWRAR